MFFLPSCKIDPSNCLRAYLTFPYKIPFVVLIYAIYFLSVKYNEAIKY